MSNCFPDHLFRLMIRDNHMNERWKHQENFNIDEVALITLALDGCFEKMEELNIFANILAGIRKLKRFKVGSQVGSGGSITLKDYVFKQAGIKLPAKFFDTKQIGDLFELNEEEFDAKIYEASKLSNVLKQRYTKYLPESSFSFSPPLPSLTKSELYSWLNEKGLKELADQFAPIELFEVSQTSDSKSRLNESAFWNDFLKMTEKAIDEYPSWSEKQKHIRLTGNVESWLIETIGTNKRGEPEIIKKVLTDIFNIKN
jgi:hypothetical protein